MEKDLISVIVPVYNIQKYIGKCLETLTNQTYKNIEIVVVNDGSTDDSLRIIEKYAAIDKRIKIIDKVNGGLSNARNVAIEQCKGKYVTTVDGDDFVVNEYVEEMYNLLINNECDISSTGRMDYIDKIDKIENINYYNELKGENIFDSTEYLKNILEDRLPHEFWGKMFKFEIIRDIKFINNLKVFEDLEFLIRIVSHKQLRVAVNTDIKTYYYRRRSNSIMDGVYNKFWEDEIDYYMDLLNNSLFLKFSRIIKNRIFDLVIRNITKILIDNNDVDKCTALKKYLKKIKLYDIYGVNRKLKYLGYKYFMGLSLLIKRKKVRSRIERK